MQDKSNYIFMIGDLRWARSDSTGSMRTLQMRKAYPQGDASGAFCGIEKDEWEDVPIVTIE